MKHLDQDQREHLDFIIRHIPQPAHCSNPMVTFFWPDMSPAVLEKRLFTLNGKSKFWAWTYDGVTPIFS